MVKYLSVDDSFFVLRYFLMQMARPHFDTPLVKFMIGLITFVNAYNSRKGGLELDTFTSTFSFS